LNYFTQAGLGQSKMINLNEHCGAILVLRKIKGHFQSSRFFYASFCGLMTDPPLSTMAASEAADLSRASAQARTPSVDLAEHQATKNFVKRDFDLTIRAYFPPPTVSTKFNPISAMTTLFRTMLKDEPSLVLCTLSNDQQIVLATASLPTRENDFKKYFKVSTARSERQKSSHVCIGCHVMSNRSLSNIKFKSTDGHFLAWLKQQRVFIESDGLGTDRPVTIGYFTKIAADLTHLTNFRDHLANQLMMVDLDAEKAVELAPHLKAAQLEAMSNGDEYVSILPEFEIYRTHLTHGREPSQVTMDVLGVKCAPRDVKLLNEFLTRMATTSTDQRDGVFVPKGAVHLLGPQIYEQVLKDHNFFLTTVATVPINLAYRAWFAVMTSSNGNENDPTSLYDHLLRKPWFLRIEEVDRRKCLIITTKTNLPEARAWIDTNLEPMIRQSIPEGIDPPAAQLPRRLDKPVYSASSKSYADVLKQKYSLASNATTSTVDNNRPPPRKRLAASILDYDSDKSTDAPSSNAAVTTSASNPCHSQPTKVTTINPDYATELLSIKSEINALKTMITEAVEQFKTAMASVATTTTRSQSNDMDTDADDSQKTTHNNQNPTDLAAIIQDLKHEIATVVNEMKTLFLQQQQQQMRNPFEGFKLTPMPT